MRTYEELVRAFWEFRNGYATFGGIADEIGENATGTLECLRLLCEAFALTVKGESGKGLSLAEHALELAENLNDLDSVSRALYVLGYIHWAMGNTKETSEMLYKSLDLIQQHSLEGEGHVLCQLGLLYSSVSDSEKAFEYYERSLTQLGTDRFEVFKAGVQVNFALLYSAVEQYEKCLSMLHEVLVRSQELVFKDLSANITGNIGIAHAKLKEYDLAEEYFKQALTLAAECEMARETSYYSVGLAEMYFLVGREEEALELLERHEEVISSNPAPRIQSMLMKARTRAANGDAASAYDSLVEVLPEYEERQDLNSLMDLYQQLMDLAKQQGDFESYVAHNEASSKIQADIASDNTSQKLAMREKEQEYQSERLKREEEHQRVVIERERERAVLYLTLPQGVADRVVRGEDVSGDHFDHASVMFLDVVGFTTNSHDLEPRVVTELLDDVFNAFDELCAKHNVTKIKTIGDAYLAVAFPVEESASTEENTSSVALAIQQLELNWPDGSPLQFRIGLHSGPVVAGVIGKQRLQYDVWGDTVNTASRMESTGEAGRIQCSDVFASALREKDEALGTRHQALTEAPGTRHQALVERGSIEIKGKGPMTTYWLEGA